MINNYPVDPMRLLQMIREGQNPQQLMMNILSQNASPLGRNLYSMIQNGDKRGIEQVARNLSRERGIDFDKEFIDFKRKLGL